MSAPTFNTQNLKEQAQRLSYAMLDLLFPPRCVVCRRPGADPLCAYCRSAFAEHVGRRCQICDLPLDSDSGVQHCVRCTGQRPDYSYMRAGYRYTGAVRQAIMALKYRGVHALSPVLIDALPAALQPPADALFCAVPMHYLRVVQRGVNHAYLLADAASHRWGNTLLPENALTRIRHTPAQARLDLEQRMANLEGAFDADRQLVAGRSIVLIDDVCTTGATLNACAKALRAAGAETVVGLTIARTI